jgi:hypothetical protein
MTQIAVQSTEYWIALSMKSSFLLHFLAFDFLFGDFSKAVFMCMKVYKKAMQHDCFSSP